MNERALLYSCFEHDFSRAARYGLSWQFSLIHSPQILAAVHLLSFFLRRNSFGRSPLNKQCFCCSSLIKTILNYIVPLKAQHFLVVSALAYTRRTHFKHYMDRFYTIQFSTNIAVFFHVLLLHLLSSLFVIYSFFFSFFFVTLTHFVSLYLFLSLIF